MIALRHRWIVVLIQDVDMQRVDRCVLHSGDLVPHDALNLNGDLRSGASGRRTQRVSVQERVREQRVVGRVEVFRA